MEIKQVDKEGFGILLKQGAEAVSEFSIVSFKF